MSAAAVRPAVFLDRDGVLNDPVLRLGRPHPPADLATFRISRGAELACAQLKQAGFALIVVTNQPDIARGVQSSAVVDAMHDELRRHIKIDEIVVCAHDDADECSCRKPKPGMIKDTAARLNLSLARSYLIGDRWRDIAAAHAAAVRAVHIDRHYLEEFRCDRPEATVYDITAAAAWILGDCTKNGE